MDKNIYQRMTEVMKDVQYLCKDDNVEFKTTKYKAISEEKVTSTVREALIKHGLVVFPVEQHRERVGSITSVDVKYRLQCVDNPEDYIIVVSSGDGADSQDKGAGKAMTYAYKYMFLRTFAIPTGEDPDRISTTQIEEETAKAKTALEEQVKTTKRLVFEHCGKDKTAAERYWQENIAGDADDADKLKWHQEVIKKAMERK